VAWFKAGKHELSVSETFSGNKEAPAFVVSKLAEFVLLYSVVLLPNPYDLKGPFIWGQLGAARHGFTPELQTNGERFPLFFSCLAAGPHSRQFSSGLDDRKLLWGGSVSALIFTIFWSLMSFFRRQDSAPLSGQSRHKTDFPYLMQYCDGWRLQQHPKPQGLVLWKLRP
jgi:hypothetical protein